MKRHIGGVEVEKHSLLISAPHGHSGQSPAQAASPLRKKPPEPIKADSHTHAVPMLPHAVR